ncbi:MAG: TadE/TadG family type IV pilus assembly protein [Hyphomicrobiales bacterium]
MFKSLRKRFRRDDKGVAAIEFAMVAPVFLMALGVIVETGLMLFSEYVLQSAVQEASRKIRTGQAQASAMSASQFKGEICKLANVVMNCNGGVTVYVKSAVDFTALKAAIPSYLSVGASFGGAPSLTSYSCGGASQAVAVIATYDWDFIMPGMGVYGNVDSDSKRRIAGFAMFLNEPFPTTTTCS